MFPLRFPFFYFLLKYSKYISTQYILLHSQQTYGIAVDAGGSKTKLYVYQSKDNKQLVVTSSITCEGKKKLGHWKLKVCSQLLSSQIAQLNPRSSPPEVVLGKIVLKIGIKFIGEQPCQSMISIKLNLQRACSVNRIPTHYS